MKENPPENQAAEWRAEEVVEAEGIAPPIDDLASNSDVVAVQGQPEKDPETESIKGEIVDLASTGNKQTPKSLKDIEAATRSVADELDGIAANGGATGALVLGVWCIAGSLLTHWSVINGVLGLLLGIWGISSKRPLLAWIGIVLCLIGSFMSMMLISEIVSDYFSSPVESF